MNAWKIISFGFGSLALIYISRASLYQPHSHGFYRFFAWEFILALFLLNVDFWLHEPFAWYQIIAWILLFASLIPLAFGVHALRRHGKPSQTRGGDLTLLAFEKTTTLVNTGIYAYIRHPLYSSLLLLTWGVFFKNPSIPSALLACVASIFLFATARADERECLFFFGTEYQGYIQTTKRFIPFLY